MSATVRDDAFTVDIGMAVDALLARMFAIRDLVALADQNERPNWLVMPEFFKKEMATLSEEQRKEADDSLAKLVDIMGQAIDAKSSDKVLEDHEISIPLSQDSRVADLIGRTIISLSHRVKVPSRAKVLRNSLLILAISDFEVFIGSIVAAVMREQPSRLDSADTSFTLSQIKEFGDVNALTEYVIERKVEDLLRGSLYDWEAWLSKLSVKMSESTDDWSSFAELFARRNLLVHNDGIVNRQYLHIISQLPNAVHADLRDRLEISEEYIETAISRLSAMCCLVGIGALLNVRKETANDHLAWLTSRAEHLAENGDIRAAHIIASTVLRKSRGRLERGSELRLRKLYWVGLRDLGMHSQMLSEVTAWDFSGLNSYYRHVRAVLLEKMDEVWPLIHELLSQGRITPLSMRIDPLYRTIKDLPEFVDLAPPYLEGVLTRIEENDSPGNRDQEDNK